MRLVRNPLAKIRQSAGFATAQAAADKLGISRTHALNIERGRVGASWGLIARMMTVYGASERQIRVAIRRAQKDLLQRKLAQL